MKRGQRKKEVIWQKEKDSFSWGSLSLRKKKSVATLTMLVGGGSANMKQIIHFHCVFVFQCSETFGISSFPSGNSAQYYHMHHLGEAQQTACLYSFCAPSRLESFSSNIIYNAL